MGFELMRTGEAMEMTKWGEKRRTEGVKCGHDGRIKFYRRPSVRPPQQDILFFLTLQIDKDIICITVKY